MPCLNTRGTVCYALALVRDPVQHVALHHGPGRLRGHEHGPVGVQLHQEGGRGAGGRVVGSLAQVPGGGRGMRPMWARVRTLLRDCM